MDEEQCNEIGLLFDDESVEATSCDIDEIQSTPSVCLIINQEYQEQLEELIRDIEDKLEENRERQAFLREKIDKHSFKKVTTKENSYIDFITPYFRDLRGLHPPPNEDTKLKLQNGELNQNYVCMSALRKWTPQDEAQLTTSIKEFYIKDQLEQLRCQRSRLLLDLQVHENDRFRLERVRSDLDECERQIQKSLDFSLVSINADLQNKIDWLYVSRQMDDVHDNLNCKLYWANYLHPQVNKADWSTEETDRLGELVKNQETFDWERIAQQLATNRKAWQVAKQYQITFNSNIQHNGPFSEEEIGHLIAVIEKCRIGHYIPWNQVFYFFEGRSIFHIKSFWTKYLRRDAKKEYWSLLEDTVLHAAVLRHQIHWQKIASYLPGRTNRQCRERYINRLGIRRHRVGNWSKTDDARIMRLASVHGADYRKIKATIKNRSESQIKARHQVLLRAKATGLSLSYKKNRTWELGTVRQKYLEDRCKRIKNFDSFLNSGRQTLLAGYDREAARKQDIELLNAQLERKKLNKLQRDEESVNSEIIKMFDHYNLIPSKFHSKPNCKSLNNLCIDEVVASHLHSMLNGEESHEDYLLNNVVKYLFSNEITDFFERPSIPQSIDERQSIEDSQSINQQSIDDSQFTNERQSINNQQSINNRQCIAESANQPPAILPPNRTTMLAFFGVLMQKANLQKIVEEDDAQEELLGNFDLDALRADPEYARLAGIFQSMFLLPAILTDTRLPSDQRPFNGDESKDDEAKDGEAKDDESRDEESENYQSNSCANDYDEAAKPSKKRKKSLKTKHERQAQALTTTKIRLQQKALFDSYFEFKKAKRN